MSIYRIAALISLGVIGTASIFHANGKADISARAVESDAYYCKIQKLGIKASTVTMNDDGFCSLVYQAGEDSKRNIALINWDGNFLFPYAETERCKYYYYDGVVSKVNNSVYTNNEQGDLDDEAFLAEVGGSCEYYSLSGKTLFEHETFISARAMTDGIAIVYEKRASDGKICALMINDKGEVLHILPEHCSNYGEAVWYGPTGFTWYRDDLIGFSSCVDYHDVSNFFDISDFGEEEELFVYAKCGYMKPDGTIVIPQQYDSVGQFYNDIAKVSANGKYGYIDKNGNTIIQLQYDNCGHFYNEFASAKTDEKWGYIDKSNTPVIPFKYDDVCGYQDGLFTVGIKNEDGVYHYGAVDKDNNVVIPIIYDDITVSYHGLVYAIADQDVYTIEVTLKDAMAGDLNADGEFTVSDLIRLQKWILDARHTYLSDQRNADLCEDGIIDVYDLALMKRKLLNQ